MTANIIAIFLSGAFVCGPSALYGQETLLVKALKGHTEAVNFVVFSTDGKQLASGGVDGTVRIWRLEDGSCVEQLNGHKSYVNSVTFSPDGRKLASASADRTIRIWNAGDGSLLNTLKGHRDYIWSVVFFPDGERIASGSDDRTIKLWGITSKRPYKTLKGHLGYVHSLSVSPDGGRIASGGTDNSIKIWDAASGKCIGTLKGHTAPVNSVAFSPTGNYLASGSEDGTIKIWQLPANQCVNTFPAGQQPVFAVAYSLDGKQIYFGNGSNAITVLYLDNGLTKTITGHASSVKTVAISPDGKYLASGSFDKNIMIWQTPEEAEKIKAKVVKEVTNYDVHYYAGLQLLSSPTVLNRLRAVLEFRKALYYRQDKVCEDKLSETLAELKPDFVKGLKYFLLAVVALITLKSFFRLAKRISLRRTLPGAIKRETLSGSYEPALNYYLEYKSIGGKSKDLPRDEMLELYRGLRSLEDLPKENIPYQFLLSYAARFTKEGNYGMAQIMLRSGRLLDAFKTPGDFETFVGLYEGARRPGYLLEAKLSPSAYSGLADAFFKIKNYDYCERICELKQRFYPGKLSSRDKELFSVSRQNMEETRKLEKKGRSRWRCINCGYVHDAERAPESCPSCAHPGEHFQTVTEG